MSTIPWTSLVHLQPILSLHGAKNYGPRARINLNKDCTTLCPRVILASTDLQAIFLFYKKKISQISNTRPLTKSWVESNSRFKWQLSLL